MSFLSLMFVFNKIGEQEGRTGSAQKQGGWWQVAQTMPTHMSKCKNDKTKKIFLIEKKRKCHHASRETVQFELTG
jgi:hypothetical protein